MLNAFEIDNTFVVGSENRQPNQVRLVDVPCRLVYRLTNSLFEVGIREIDGLIAARRKIPNILPSNMLRWTRKLRRKGRIMPRAMGFINRYTEIALSQLCARVEGYLTINVNAIPRVPDEGGVASEMQDGSRWNIKISFLDASNRVLRNSCSSYGQNKVSLMRKRIRGSIPNYR